MSIEYRKFQKSDLHYFADLPDDNWKSTSIMLAHLLLNDDNTVERCYIALENTTMIGFIYGFVLPNKTLILELMYVKPEYRHHGIGSSLLAMLEQESGCIASMVFYNKSLHNYYQKLGYSTGDNLETAIKTLNFKEA